MARPRSKKARAALLWPQLALLALLVGACSSDGCSSGCGGITPLAGGYPADKRIENAAALRLTQQGIDFLEANIGVLASQLLGGGQGVIEFPVDESSGTVGGFIDYTICPGGPDPATKRCIVEMDLANANLSITPLPNHNIQVAGPVPIRIQQLPLDNSLDDLDITLSGNGSCPGENSTFQNVQATIDLSLEVDLDTTHARYGYSRIRILNVQISQTDIENGINFCNGGIFGALLNFARGFIIGFIYDSFLGTINDTVQEQLCQKANPAVSPPCPTGTNDVDGICRYGSTPDDECVPMALGLDGHANLSGLLASVSPGTKGGMDFLLAGGGASVRDDGSGFHWGDLNPIGGGATVGAMGGVEPNPISGCVPMSSLALPTGLKIPNELIDDSLAATGWPAGMAGPHIGIGVSESYFNYALNGMYNSGLLCIGISTETVDLLNSDTLGLLAGSLKNLALQRQKAPVAVVLKPKQPPHVTFGNGTNLDTDPLLHLELREAGFDFYIFSHDRFIRFMSAEFDIDAPINLTVTPEGLVPVMDKLTIANGKVSNSELIKEDPAVLAAALQGLLSGQIGGLLGSGLGPIDINGALASLGMELVIPESVEGMGSPGLRTVTKDGERFLGIFAALQVAGQNPANIETEATVEDVQTDERGLRAETITPDNAPVVVLQVEAAGADGRAVEHQARVDGGVWKPWSRDRFLRVTDDSLRLEGRHEIQVRSRVVGQLYSVDPTPEVLEVLIDTQAPTVTLLPVDEEGVGKVDVWDLVSGDATLVRFRFDGQTFSEWRRAGDLKAIVVPEEAELIEFELADEKGNVGTAQQEIIRGAPRDAGSGCGCALPGEQPARSGTPWELALIALAGVLTASRLRRRARQSAAHAAAAAGVLATGAFSGCSCDDETKPDTPLTPYTCVDPCVPLQPGLIGSYTSTVVAGDGTLWVAGYLEADYDNVDLQGQPLQYGDLVVGRYDGTQVAWEIVDGVPTEPAADGTVFDLNGFRGGQSAPGDDVGLWTSIGVVDENPVVAYYDRTNKALKYASHDGTRWTVTTVDDGPSNDVGRYASLVVEGSTAVIAYLAIEPASDGFITSKVKLARGGASGFTFEDVDVNTSTPCRPDFCIGSICAIDTGLCSASASGCTPDCAAGDECVQQNGAPTCVAAPKTKLDAYPFATGTYLSMVPNPAGGLAIAHYDRVAGTLVALASSGSGWSRVVVDGGVAPDGSIGDVGIGASLFVDAQGWHLSYVDGYNEALKYAQVVGGVVQSVEVVDDGLGNGLGTADGLHVVGDDSFIDVTPQGEVHISYQDATTGKLRYAVGVPASTGHTWTVKEAQTDGFGGFFSSQVKLDNQLRLVHWWRKSKERTEGNVAVISPP